MMVTDPRKWLRGSMFSALLLKNLKEDVQAQAQRKTVRFRMAGLKFSTHTLRDE